MAGGDLPAPNLLLTIRGLLPSLNEQEQKVGQYVLDHPYEVIHLPMAELAERCGVGDTTIFRFCRRVRMDGYQDFKITLARELPLATPAVYAAVAAGDSLAQAAHKVIADDMKSLEDTFASPGYGQLARAAEGRCRPRWADITGRRQRGRFADRSAVDARVRQLYTDAHCALSASSWLRPAARYL